MSLENVHAGDTLIRTSDYGRRRKVAVVDHETKTMLVVGRERFHRRNGFLVGQTGYANFTFIRVPRVGEAESVAHENRERILCGRIRLLVEQVAKSPLEALERIFTAMEKEYANCKIDPS